MRLPSPATIRQDSGFQTGKPQIPVGAKHSGIKSLLLTRNICRNASPLQASIKYTKHLWSIQQKTAVGFRVWAVG